MKTTMYRPESEDFAHRMISESLDILVDMRVRDEVLEAARALPDHLTPELSWSRREAVDEGDTNTLKATLRLLLPSGGGIGERWFRVQHGWSGDEVGHIASLLRAVEAGLRFHADHAALDGTAKMLLLDASRAKSLAGMWERCRR